MRLENCSAELQELLIASLPFNEYREDLSGAVVHFAKMVAQEFILEEEMSFEVRGGWDRSSHHPRLEAARLEYVYLDSIVRVGPWMYQMVPPEAEEENSPGKVIRLDSKRIVTFKPPHHLRRALSRLRSGFLLIARPEHEWMMSMGRQEVHEDFKAVVLAYNVHRARLSAPLGWNARGLFGDHIADFHWAMRELRWQRFCIEVRDSILTTLGEVFALIGSWRGESPRLIWEHLPTIQQVEEGEKQIMDEGARFEDVLKPFRLQ
ncbi:MAG: hypothetical protein A2Y95_12940 [Deltaproteobacteria bacterium RBG_13_65_10]|nr:MAG: hypothetical protein A2Y95_12940 [Deltaproteobacteria bacterium RBG_13_65_10]